MIKIYSIHNTDCLRASISSIIEIDLIDFPNLIISGKDWASVLRNYMESRGYKLTFYNILDDDELNNYHLVTYKNPYIKNQYHCVVGKNGKIVYNPSENDNYDYSELPIDYYGVIVKI